MALVKIRKELKKNLQFPGPNSLTQFHVISIECYRAMLKNQKVLSLLSRNQLFICIFDVSIQMAIFSLRILGKICARLL